MPDRDEIDEEENNREEHDEGEEKEDDVETEKETKEETDGDEKEQQEEEDKQKREEEGIEMKLKEMNKELSNLSDREAIMRDQLERENACLRIQLEERKKPTSIYVQPLLGGHLV